MLTIKNVYGCSCYDITLGLGMFANIQPLPLSPQNNESLDIWL